MKIIKDTIPNTEWESKTGKISHIFTSGFGKTKIDGNTLLIPIQPLYAFVVDEKIFGEFQCEKIANVKRDDANKEKSLYGQTIATMMEFDLFIRTQFSIPNSVIMLPPKFEDINIKIGLAVNP